MVHQGKIQFLGNMNKELTAIEQEIHKDALRAFERLIGVLTKSEFMYTVFEMNF